MGNMEGQLGYAATTTSSDQLHWWKSPRWIVIRIEALAVVAIIISFFLVVFGSCRRWSNSWIVQKGFIAAQVLSLSLGTYSIGLMQSSSVKSEMYPVWTVSLFTLFGCIDPVSTYNGLDYKGPLSKVVYGICLNCGYVLLMSISTISNVVSKAAIITLSAITFIKGFHRSFALVQQNRMRDMVYTLDDFLGETCVLEKDNQFSCDDRCRIIVDPDTGIHQTDIELSIRNNMDKRLQSCYDVCVAFGLSHKLQRHFLGLGYREPRPSNLDIDFKWALKVIEIELAFMYDAFFTGNPFLHYYQAKTASLWALASFTGICFVLVVTVIPGGIPRDYITSGCTNVVGTTIADLAITFGILVSLALLQLTQLVRSWTSKWARAAVACAYARKEKTISCARKEKTISRAQPVHSMGTYKLNGWLRLKVFVATSTNMFDKYLWQTKISQYSMLPEPILLTGGRRKGEGISSSETKGEPKWGRLLTGWWKRKDEKGFYSNKRGERTHGTCVQLVQSLGLHYIWQVIYELFSSDTNKRAAVTFDDDIKASITDFLSQIQSDRLDKKWLLSLPKEPQIRYFLPHFNDPELVTKSKLHCSRYTSCVMTWHIVTWYCELEEQKRQEDALMCKQAEAPLGCARETAATASYYLRKAAAAIPQPSYCFQRRAVEGEGEAAEAGKARDRDHRRVANALSMYCAYLVKSAPELLPGPVEWTKRVYDYFAQGAKEAKIEACDKDTILGKMSDDIFFTTWNTDHVNFHEDIRNHRFPNGGALAKLLMSRYGPDKIWKTLELVWVQLLVYAAPYGNVEAHMRHLSQGGEFITHLWALLYHLDIREWKVQKYNNLHNIKTEDEARMIHGHPDAVVFFASKDRLREYSYEIGTAASLMIDDVLFYQTSNRYVAMSLNFPAKFLYSPAASEVSGIHILYLNNTYKKFIFLDSRGGRAIHDLALFVYDEKKLASAKARAQETTPSTFHGPIPIKKQNSEDGQTVVEIEEEMPPPAPSCKPCAYLSGDLDAFFGVS